MSLLKALAGVFSTYRSGRNNSERLILKLESPSILAFEIVRSIWPTTPAVILIRNPLEVMVSNLTRPSEWLAMRLIPPKQYERRNRACTDGDMSVEEYAARVLARYYESALAAAITGVEVIDYSVLDLSAIERVFARFGMDASSLPPRILQEQLLNYSKKPELRRPYQQDSKQKIAQATSAMRRATEIWVNDPYQRLLRGTISRVDGGGEMRSFY